ncbi:MAG TPA: universal stress protein [Methylomirabilota bacterium]|nr:universal stress protein [Methylomirabilota bacterium]
MTMRVLLATDGSEDAKAATAWLGGLPLPADARVRVITALALPPSPLDIAPVRELYARLRHEARAHADDARAALRARFPGIEVEVVDGDPRAAIVRAAESWPADLVVTGARGLGGIKELLLGSVSLGVVRHAPCPVLVVKGAARPLGGALVALDGSEHAAAAAAWLAQLPLESTTVVRLLGVVERPRFPSTVPAMATAIVREAIDQIVSERRAALLPALERAAGLFAGSVKSVEQRVVVGHPTDEIVRAAGESGVDLVVVGARGLGGLERLLLGSVSEGVLHHVARPVLVVRPAR